MTQHVGAMTVGAQVAPRPGKSAHPPRQHKDSPAFWRRTVPKETYRGSPILLRNSTLLQPFPTCHAPHPRRHSPQGPPEAAEARTSSTLVMLMRTSDVVPMWRLLCCRTPRVTRLGNIVLRSVQQLRYPSPQRCHSPVHPHACRHA